MRFGPSVQLSARRMRSRETSVPESVTFHWCKPTVISLESTRLSLGRDSPTSSQTRA